MADSKYNALYIKKGGTVNTAIVPVPRIPDTPVARRHVANKQKLLSSQCTARQKSSLRLQLLVDLDNKIHTNVKPV